MSPGDQLSFEVSITEEGYERLREELTRLTTVDRRAIADRLRAAYESGDSEEGAVVATIAREQERLELRIRRLEDQLLGARVVREGDLDPEIVQIGSRVTVRRVDQPDGRSYQVVSPAESDPRRALLSSQSPLGRALLGHRAGEVVSFERSGRVEEVRIEAVVAP